MKGRDLVTAVVLDMLLTIIFVAIVVREWRWGFFFFVILLFLFWIIMSRIRGAQETEIKPDIIELCEKLGIGLTAATAFYNSGYHNIEDFNGAILDDLLMVDGIKRADAERVLDKLKKQK